MTAAAATGYCLAKHPYQTLIPGVDATPEHPRGFTPDGYEMVLLPGIVGAVRRNFVHSRSTIDLDEGRFNSCSQACSQFGKPYEPSYSGISLQQKLSATTTISSGIGDMGVMAIPDRDFYLNKEVIAGIRSLGNNWHESDVAQADFCCCGLK
jgi:hypothetical protein